MLIWDERKDRRRLRLLLEAAGEACSEHMQRIVAAAWALSAEICDQCGGPGGQRIEQPGDLVRAALAGECSLIGQQAPHGSTHFRSDVADVAVVVQAGSQGTLRATRVRRKGRSTRTRP